MCHTEALMQHCREQLRRSLAVQMDGRKSLEAMRADFERLTQQLAAATQGSSQATQEEALDSAGQSPSGLLPTVQTMQGVNIAPQAPDQECFLTDVSQSRKSVTRRCPAWSLARRWGH